MTVAAFIVGATVAAVLLGGLVRRCSRRRSASGRRRAPGRGRATCFGRCFARSRALLRCRHRRSARGAGSACRRGCASSHSSRRRRRSPVSFTRSARSAATIVTVRRRGWSLGDLAWSRNRRTRCSSSLRRARGRRRQRADVRSVRGHDGRLRRDGAGRGALARGGLRRALPPLLPRAPRLFHWRRALGLARGAMQRRQ